MARESFAGMDALLSLFDNLPAATDAEIRTDLPNIGAVVLSVQKNEVAVRTGDLWRGLSVQTRNGGRTIRVGLLGQSSEGVRSGKTSYGGLYYGRFVEFGRHAQVVQVQRRRLVNGKLRSRRGRKLAEDIAATYSMKVPAMPARPFVNSPAAETAALDAAENLANFWSNVIQRAGGAA